MTKKLQRLLLKYKKANRVRLTAYARRCRILAGKAVKTGEVDANGWAQWVRVFKVPITDELKAQLDADIQKARLYKLEVSKELRAYCKKKKYHLQWGNSNQITKVRTHTEWHLRKYPQVNLAGSFMDVVHKLKLVTTHFWASTNPNINIPINPRRNTMFIKAQTVIPAGTKITKCKPSDGKGKNIYSLLRAEEHKLEKQAELKTKAEHLTELLKSGFSVVEAIQILSK